MAKIIAVWDNPELACSLQSEVLLCLFKYQIVYRTIRVERLLCFFKVGTGVKNKTKVCSLSIIIIAVPISSWKFEERKVKYLTRSQMDFNQSLGPVYSFLFHLWLFIKSSNLDQIDAVVPCLGSEQFKYQELKGQYDMYSPQIAHKTHTFVLT